MVKSEAWFWNGLIIGTASIGFVIGCVVGGAATAFYFLHG
jgi:hypothetical protein